MPDSISPQTEEKIRQFCQKISIACGLDYEIQEELYGHFEDRVLGYLAGEERLTEEDAFVLVREHFGSPENIKELMKIAHRRENRKTISGKVIRKSMVIVAVSMIAAWFIAGHVYTVISGMVTSTGINHSRNIYHSRSFDASGPIQPDYNGAPGFSPV